MKFLISHRVVNPSHARFLFQAVGPSSALNHKKGSVPAALPAPPNSNDDATLGFFGAEAVADFTIGLHYFLKHMPTLK